MANPAHCNGVHCVTWFTLDRYPRPDKYTRHCPTFFMADLCFS